MSGMAHFLIDGGKAGLYIVNGQAASEDRSLEGAEVAYNISIGGHFYFDDGTDSGTVHHNVIDCQNRSIDAILVRSNNKDMTDVKIHNNVLMNYDRYGALVVNPEPGNNNTFSNNIMNKGFAPGGFAVKEVN